DQVGDAGELCSLGCRRNVAPSRHASVDDQPQGGRLGLGHEIGAFAPFFGRCGGAAGGHGGGAGAGWCAVTPTTVTLLTAGPCLRPVWCWARCTRDRWLSPPGWNTCWYMAGTICRTGGGVVLVLLLCTRLRGLHN